ncbi:hypothetical protein BGX28_001172 [Mortierella sp. GBA30]|nr:hypothetical protein BGX28_001172 [Mortierella sp. GBA30]
MLNVLRVIFGIAVLTLCLTGVVFCAPDAARTPTVYSRQPLPFERLQGTEPTTVLREVATHLHQDSLVAWDTVFGSVETMGASDMQIVNRSEVASVMQTWRLGNIMTNPAIQQVNVMIQRAIDQRIHSVQGEVLSMGDKGVDEEELTLSTLLVTVRVRQTGNEQEFKVELGHIIMITSAKMINASISTMRQGSDIDIILNNFQSAWALNNIPVATVTLPEESTVVLKRRQLTDPRFQMIVESIKQFAESWEKQAKVLASSVSSTVQRKVCLGFDAVSYKADSFVMTDVPKSKIMAALRRIMKANGLPNDRNINNVALGIQYSTNFSWVGSDFFYKDSNGNQAFLFLAKHGNQKKKTVDVVYSRVRSDFLLAQDMFVVREHKSYLWGLWKSDKTYINHIPHTMTLNDEMILEKFFQMIAFKQMAIATRVRAPKMPDLSFLCDKSDD